MDINWGYVLSAVALFVASLVVSLVVVAVVLVKIPEDYFLDCHDRELWVDRHPLVRMALKLGKNVLGLCLVATGILLSLPGIPGQGLLTVLIGLMLLDFPGKRRWERRLVSLPRIFKSINRLRRRFGKAALRLEEDQG